MPDLAAQMLSYIQNQYEDIYDHTIADLGCGCGMLSIAAALLGAK
jgi:predicted RNA methylase